MRVALITPSRTNGKSSDERVGLARAVATAQHEPPVAELEDLVVVLPDVEDPGAGWLPSDQNSSCWSGSAESREQRRCPPGSGGERGDGDASGNLPTDQTESVEQFGAVGPETSGCSRASCEGR